MGHPRKLSRIFTPTKMNKKNRPQRLRRPATRRLPAFKFNIILYDILFNYKKQCIIINALGGFNHTDRKTKNRGFAAGFAHSFH